MSIARNFKSYPGAVHELVAEPGHASAAIGAGLALAGKACASAANGTAVLWVREASAVTETGDVYGPGLISFGISPDCLIAVEARTHVDALRAALEGVRCAALSAVMLETYNAVDLTASRRLKLASEKSGVAVVLIRLTNASLPNAAQVRWRVSAALQTAAPANRELTTFQFEILKHPAGLVGKTSIMEWHHVRHSFAEAISMPLVPITDIGSLAA